MKENTGRRTKSIHGDGAAALTPASDLPLGDTTRPQLHGSSEHAWLKKLLAMERRRHASVEAVMTRMVQQLEQQVSDLRNLYFEKIALTPTEKP